MERADVLREEHRGGGNTVTATFATGITSFGIVYIHEYSGLDPNNPLDVTSSAVGTTAAMSSGAVTTTHANDLLFGAGASSSVVTAGGAGYTVRSTASGNLTEDRSVTATGSYAATATQDSNAWVMQVVAFKAADLAPRSAFVRPVKGRMIVGNASGPARSSCRLAA